MVKLFGADKSSLSCAGPMAQPVTLYFKDQDTGDYITYNVQPLVIRGLAVPFLMAHRDLKNLHASLNLSQNRMAINPSGVKVTLPLTSMPESDYDVTASANVTIWGGQEMPICITVPDAHEGEHVWYETDPRFQRRTLLGCRRGVTTVKNGRGTLCLVNLTDQPVTIKKGTKLAIGYHHVDEVPDPQEMAVCAINALKKAGPIPLPEPGEDYEELFKKIWIMMDMDRESCLLTKEQKIEVVDLITRYRDVLALEPTDIGTVKDFTFEIPTTGPPLRSKHRPVPPNLRDALANQIQTWLTQGVIEPCSGPWASPLVPVRKKNGSWRWAVDYRRVNSVTRKDARPVANLSEKLALLKGRNGEKMSMYASLDLSEAYHHISVKEEDRDKTAVCTEFGLFRFKKMSFGLSAAPAAFHLVVQAMEAGLMERDADLASFILSYFDDILIGGETYERMRDRLHLLLDQLKLMGLRINPKKCRIGDREVKYLGVLVSPDGIRPDPDLTKDIRDYKPPRNLSEARALHGLLSYFRRFIRNFAKRTHHLRALIKADGTFEWTQNHQLELEDMKRILLSNVILAHPDFSEKSGPFILSVDTSSRGVGCTLSQEQEYLDPETKETTRREFVIGFCSRRLTKGERSYSSYKLELTGLLSAVQHYRYFLLGKRFVVRTDHSALTWLKSSLTKELPHMVQRYQTQLEDYDYDIQYTPATRMGAADGLSRRGYEDDEWGIMSPPRQIHEDLWDDEPTLEQAQTTDHEFWTTVMKRRHHTVSSVNIVNAVTRQQSKDLKNTWPNLMDQTDMPFVPGELQPGESNFETESSVTEVAGGTQTTIQTIKSQFLKQCAIEQKKDGISKCLVRLMENQKWPHGDQELNLELQNVDEELRRDYKTLLRRAKDGQAYRINPDTGCLEIHLSEGQGDWWRPLLPECMIDEAIKVCHHGMGTAHKGSNCTKIVAKWYFYTPRLAEKVSDFVSKCKVCVEGKKLPVHNTGGMGQTSSALKGIPLVNWYLDTHHMPDGTYGRSKILTAYDPVTKWLEARSVKNATAKVVGDFIQDYLVARYGLGLHLTCDNGKEFLNQTIKQIIQNSRGTLHYGTPYRPESLPVERLHLDLDNQIRTTLQEKELGIAKWPEVLSEALMNLRSSPDSYSEVSAHFKVYGKHPKIAAELWFGYKPEGAVPTHKLKDRKLDEEHDDGPPEKLHEDDECLVLRHPDGQEIKYFKVNINDKEPALVQVNLVASERENAIALGRQKAQEDHERNQARVRKGKTRFYPVPRELVDWMSKVDPDCPNSRKYANLTQGPFLLDHLLNEHTASVIPLELESLSLDRKKKRQVSIAQLKPSLRWAHQRKPKGDWIPSWMDHVAITQQDL